MKRRMKRNKLLKKVLTLGLAAAVAVTSMAPTLGMLKPVVVQAATEDEGAAVTQEQTAEATKITGAQLAEVSKSVQTKYFNEAGDIPDWLKNMEKVSEISGDEYVKGVKVVKSGNDVTGIIVKAPIAEMKGDEGVVSIPIVLTFDAPANNGTFGGEVFSDKPDPDPEFENRSESIAQAWLYLNEECDSSTGQPTNIENSAKYKNTHAVMWIRSDNTKYFTETGRIIKIGSNSYSVKVEDTTKPSVQIDFAEKKLTSLDSEKSYMISIDGAAANELTGEGGDSIEINSEWFGHKISISQKGDNINSAPQELMIPAKPAAPALSSFEIVNVASGGEKGSVTPLIDGLEYSTDSGSTWNEAVKNTIVEVDKDATISFRAKATNSSFAGEACDITIREQKTEEIKISAAGEAEIANGLTAGDADLDKWKYNTNTEGLVESVTLNDNVITVNAKVGDMKKMTTAGDQNHRAFPIVVDLEVNLTGAEESYSIDNEDSKGPERINDAWKFKGYETQAAAEAAAGYESGKSCVIWLSEYWTGDGHIISFDGINMYTVKVNDTSKYNITPNTPIANASVKLTDENDAEVALTGVEIGKNYNITIEAEGGYYFDDGVADTLKQNGYVAAPGDENVKYTLSYSLSRKAADYESKDNEDKTISVIPAGITVTSIEKEGAPTTDNVNIKYVQGGLIFTTAGKYLIDDNPAKYYASGDKYPVTPDQVGTTIKVKKAARDKFHKDSEALSIEIRNVPKPTGLGIVKITSEGASDGKITSVTNKMEYRKDTGTDWINCPNTEITDLEAGTYYVRYKTNDETDTAGFEDSDVFATVEIVDENTTYIHLEADRDSVTGSMTYGTTETLTITITCVGESSSTPASIKLDDTGDTRFNLSTENIEIDSDDRTKVISITAPNTLAVGTYNETLRVSYVDGSNVDKHVLVQIYFTVNPLKWSSLTGKPTGSSSEAGKIVVDITGITNDSGAPLEYGYSASDMAEPTQTYSNPTITGVATGEYYVFVRAAADSNHDPSDWVVSAEKVSVTGTTSSDGGSGNTGGGNTGGGSGSGSGSGSGGTGTTGTTPTPTPTTPVVPAATTTADGTTVTLNKDGVYVDKNGKPAVNAVIKEPTGTLHITDATGHVVKDSLATAADGNTYVVSAEGNVVISDIAEIKGNKYIANEKGQLVVNAFSTIGGEKYYSDAEGVVKTDGFFNAAGKKYYANEDGVVAVNKLITVNGKKYFSTKSGAIATKMIVKVGGKKYFATKSGKIATNKIVKTGGKKYFATKNGSLAKNKWVKVGNKKYFCNKKGVITKTKKIKAK